MTNQYWGEWRVPPWRPQNSTTITSSCVEGSVPLQRSGLPRGRSMRGRKACVAIDQLTNQLYICFIFMIVYQPPKRSKHIETYVFNFLVALIICSVLPFLVYIIDMFLFLQSRVFFTRFIQELNPQHPIPYIPGCPCCFVLYCIVLYVSPRQLHSMCGKPNARNHPQATQWPTIWGILKPWPYPKRVFVTLGLHCYRPFPTVYDKVRGVMRQRCKPWSLGVIECPGTTHSCGIGQEWRRLEGASWTSFGSRTIFWIFLGPTRPQTFWSSKSSADVSRAPHGPRGFRSGLARGQASLHSTCPRFLRPLSGSVAFPKAVGGICWSPKLVWSYARCRWSWERYFLGDGIK